VLHYDRDQIAWECNELIANERFPRGLGSLLEKNDWTPRPILNSALLNAQETQIPGRSLAEIWRPIVRLYSTLSITRWSDRLVALTGIAHKIQSALGWQYEAGMFTGISAPSQLLWRPICGDLSQLHDQQLLEKKATRRQPIVAPTWSWLSLDAPVEFMPQWKRIPIEADPLNDAEMVSLHPIPFLVHQDFIS
jgi:hypothetical protein